MWDALAHRGPDGRGVWLAPGGSVALGHLALYTTPESRREAQPLVRPESGVTLVADARIDNREELIGALGVSRASAPTDAELIAAAYDRWGEGCAERLIGDFAFALWDVRKRTLFCARDPMGVKPFYYFREQGHFAFASEAKALFTIPGVDLTIDEEQIALFLGWHHEERSRTVYRHIFRLPAAHTLVVTPDRVALRSYWSADGARDVRLTSEADYEEAFREIFGQAVSARLRCQDAVGATLSGGLDSSSVACMARELRGPSAPPLPTFSLIFPELPERELRMIDERSFVDAAVRGGGLNPTYIRGDKLSPLSEVDRIVWHLDEPFSMPNLYLHWAMFGAAGDAGVRVLLDGFDGDSAVSHGFGYLTDLVRAGDIDMLAAEMRAFSSRHAKSPAMALDAYVLPYLSELARGGRLIEWSRTASRLRRRFGLARWRVATRHGITAFMPKTFDWSRQRESSEHTLLQPALARFVHGKKVDLARRERRRAMPSERAAHVEGISQPLYQLTLEVADKCAAAFGVEPRYPFFDRRLIEFCIGLPGEQKFGGGWPRFLLRRAMQGILPPEIQWRTMKSNLSPNFHRQFRAVDVRQRPIGSGGALATYARVDRLMELRRAYESCSASQRMRAEGLALFRAAVLEAWLTQPMDSNRRQSPDVRVASPAAA